MVIGALASIAVGLVLKYNGASDSVFQIIFLVGTPVFGVIAYKLSKRNPENSVGRLPPTDTSNPRS